MKTLLESGLLVLPELVEPDCDWKYMQLYVMYDGTTVPLYVVLQSQNKWTSYCAILLYQWKSNSR